MISTHFSLKKLGLHLVHAEYILTTEVFTLLGNCKMTVYFDGDLPSMNQANKCEPKSKRELTYIDFHTYIFDGMVFFNYLYP